MSIIGIILIFLGYALFGPTLREALGLALIVGGTLWVRGAE